MKAEILNHTLINSLGMTLLHSLWQIFAVYIILRIVLSLLKASNSKAKYILSALSMILILVFSLVTFSIYQNMDKPEESLVFYHLTKNIDNGGEQIMSYPVPMAEEPGIRAEKSISDYLPWFVAAYFLGLIIMTFRLLSGLLYLRKFKTRGIVELSADLEDIFLNLLKKIKIRKKIMLIESVLTRVPFVLGYLKPLIIVPAGLFSKLPFNQIEAILAHELAHIKRNDYIINIVQSMVEILFFFHPVIYLISKRIRDERENCCDDIALKYCEEPSHYVKALASLENLRLKTTYPAVAFVKSRNSLLTRIKRILKPNNMKTKISDRIFAGIIIVLGLATILITGAAALNNYSSGEEYVNPEETSINLSGLYADEYLKDSIVEFDEGRIITHRKNAKGKDEEIEMVFENGQLSALSVNGKEIPAKDYPEYTDVVKNTLKDVRKAQDNMEDAKKDLAEFNESELRMEIAEAMAEIESIDKEAIMREVQQAMEEVKAEMAEIDMEQIRSEVETAMAEIDMDEIRAEIAEAMKDVEYEMKNAMTEEEWENLRQEKLEAMNSIDWDVINESVKLAMESAMKSMEGLDEIVEGSVEVGLGAAQAVLENLDEIIYGALKSVESIDVDAIISDIENANQDIERDSQNLEILEKNMEKALMDLEKDQGKNK